MKHKFNLLVIILLVFLFQGCNTMYNFRFINIEVVEPGKFYFPEKYSSAAIIYNNTYTSFNKDDAIYIFDNQINNNIKNNEGIVYKDYFSSFVFNLRNQVYFDSVVFLEPVNYKNVIFSDSLINFKNDSLLNIKISTDSINVASVILASLLTNRPADTLLNTEKKFIDPFFGLYSESDLKKISDSTNTDILISLDFYKMADARTNIRLNSDMYFGEINFFSFGLWNFYDLKNKKPLYYYIHNDTIKWEATAYFKDELIQSLPTRENAILSGAFISGENFAGILVPKWVSVERLYYISGQVDLIPAERLINEGKWEEAVFIWEKHMNNPNKNIAAKCLFNLGIASEMAGDFDEAINWIVQSYHVFGNNNTVHAENCMDYINILGQRKADLILLEEQLNPKL
jgi:hypothetical protein